MIDFTNHTIDTGPEQAKALLHGSKQKIGFIPNLYARIAEAPALLEGCLAIAGVFGKASFSTTERQIVLMPSNRLNGCAYCMAARTSISQMSSVTEDVVIALGNNTPIANIKLEALRQFTIVVVASRGRPHEDQVDIFLNVGYTRQNILEVVFRTAMKVMSNYTNHIVNTPLDEAFKPNAWSSPLAKVA